VSVQMRRAAQPDPSRRRADSRRSCQQYVTVFGCSSFSYVLLAAPSGESET
jgi:hypothetical protein